MRQLIRTYEITGQHEIIISNYSFTKEDVRLIINESLASTDKLASVLVSSTAKDNIVSVEEGIITLADTTAELNTDDVLTIEIDIDNVAKEDTATANKNELSRQIDYYGDQIERVTEDTVEAAKRDIMGADSTNVFDCGQSIPACSFDDGNSYDINLDSDKYWLGGTSECEIPDAGLAVGSVLRATEVDAEEGYLLCTSFTNPPLWLSAGNVNKSGDDYYLDTSGGATFVPVEANKNYRCKEVVELKYIKITLPAQTITGYLYIWEEYEGCSIHDAKEEINDKLGDVEDALEYIEGGGLPTITAIAKQGTNASATLTATQAAVVDGNDTAVGVSKEIRREVGTGSDTAAESGTLFAVVKWVKDKVKSIYNLIGSPAQGQPSTLFAAIAAGGGGGGDAQESTSQEILAKVQQLVDNAFIDANYSGVVFRNDYTPQSIIDLYYNADKIIAIRDNSLETANVSLFHNLPALPSGAWNITEIELNELRSFSGREFFRNLSTVKKISMPKLESSSFHEIFYSCPVEELYIPSLTTVTSIQNPFLGCVNLILINAGRNVSASFNFLSAWNPTNALNASSSSLVKPGETYANNLEKFLYNIRTYIAAELPDRTGLSSLTITLHSNVKAAINADAATAQAFSNKNWTIA